MEEVEKENGWYASATVHFTTYENGKFKLLTSFRNNNLYSRGFYKDGHPSKLVTYYLNGETATELIHLGLGKLQHVSWNQSQSKTEDYTTQDDYLLGKGHYALNDSTTAFFKAPKAIYPSIPVTRVIITNGDTIQKDYVKNSVAYRNKILLSNFYSESLRDGLWKEYEDNYIDYVATYKNGILDGRAIYYINNTKTPYPEYYGYYVEGLKDGNWTFLSKDTVESTFFKEGKKEGKFIKFSRKADTLVTITESSQLNVVSASLTHSTISINEQIDTISVANYSNDLLNGEYYEFDSTGVISIRGNYLDNQKHGLWYLYQSNGEIRKEGEFKNGQLKGNWHEWVPNKKGKLKRRKLVS